MESVSCIICNSNSPSFYKKIKDLLNSSSYWKVVKCDCGLIYLNPRPDSKEMSRYYSDSYLPYRKDGGLLVIFYKFAKKITLFWKYKILSKHSPNCTKALDYGGGSGDFSNYLLNKNISSINYDPNCNNALSSIDAYPSKKNFDIISFWHSIEHIHNIEDVFNNIDSLLKKDGILLIAIPNHEAYERKYFFHNQWIAYDPPRHLYHFNFQTFKSLLGKYNFTIEKTYPMYQDTFFNILMSSMSKNPFKFIYRSIRSVFAIFLDKNFSSSLLFVCRKQR